MGVEVNVDHIAEYTSGVATGIPDLACLTAEVGVGGVVISGGRLLGGADGFAGIGHAMIDPSGARCRCGRLGCRETEVGPAALVGMATPDRPYGTGPQVVRDTEERLAEIEQRRADGDPHAEAGRWPWIGAAQPEAAPPASPSERLRPSEPSREPRPLSPLALTRPRPPHLPPA
ncbi:ROK family protein [Nonomuraea sp. C10]|uniref:ROK family protein n=1 Tax=Nonomuraea sp. C10 TaxID=2600577 RepID=UPI0011CDA40C|nr:ROK family protein [Nonomuraea sp. C10]TXK42162.1 ROK family protein [Nonomuraea sp. C10]